MRLLDGALFDSRFMIYHIVPEIRSGIARALSHNLSNLTGWPSTEYDILQISLIVPLVTSGSLVSSRPG
jgi:hypothetical protein